MILLGSNHYSSSVSSFNTHSIDLEASSSQYLSITDASQTGLDITGDMTIEAWVNFETLTDEWIVTKHATNPNSGFACWYNPTNKFRFLVSNNGTNNSIVSWNSVTTPTLGVWYHLAIIYDAIAGSAELFINGVSQGTQTGLYNSIYNNTASFKIGEADRVSFPFDGLIDDVRIWNIKRTSTEIANNFNKELTGTEPNLQGYWKLNNSPNDLTSNANHLTETNSPVYSTDTPF